MTGLFRREWKNLWADPWQLALLTYIPILTMLLLLWIFNSVTPRDLPVAVVDLDKSQMSQTLAHKLEASPSIKLVSFYNLDEAKTAMHNADVFALVVFPDNMRKDLLTGHSPIIDVRYNSQFLLVGKLLASQIQQALGAGLKDVSMYLQYARGIPKAQAELNLSPIAMQITPLYNHNSHYQIFLMPAIWIALGQIVMMLTFANSLGRELRHHSVAQWLQFGLLRALWVKAAVYIPLSVVQFSALTLLLFQYLSLDVNHAFLLLLLAQVLMTIVVWLIVLTIFMTLRDSARMVSFCTALFAPAFPFMGVTFPTNNMPIAAQWWRMLMPSSHYIEQQMAVLHYHASLSELVMMLTQYLPFLLLLPITYLGARKLRAAIA
ncbi:ABC transporter permease [Shewanella intestini]|uniref:ABC transporter permease n=1 Tax=Shewanella intestini TaxID=2017544 RepID=A0ABS5I407_9GAMM|nr:MULTISPECIES: ABC transporter permease [Shewanella]MBR9728764.1 ABC transporter permease [Shewanella intestini]MRG36839.1 ABC transporter permease [Shewanella sp. XMDDZSB0408]